MNEDLARIDSAVEMLGELIGVESGLVHAPELSSSASLELRSYLGQLTKLSRDLRGVALRLRRTPMRGLFQRMAHLVRDLSEATGKRVRFVQLGESTEMDRSLLERIEEPLFHLLQNAIEHAIEPSEQRLAAGKAEVAVITIAAEHVAGCLELELRDDGSGLSPVVSEPSGCVSGLDLVKRSIEALRGRVAIHSTPGAGTTVRLVLPLTLEIIDGTLLACGSERYIVSSASIVESLELESNAIEKTASDEELVAVCGELWPVRRLSLLFDAGRAERRGARVRVVVVECGRRRLALEVDDVVTQQELLIKPSSESADPCALLSGSATLSDGRLARILNIERIVELFGNTRGYPDAAE